MKVLVTGGAGFIGSHIADLYIENGYEVVIVDDLSTGRLTNVNARATFYQMDICDPQLKEIFAKERPDYVNHHAAQMNVRRSVLDPLFDANVNIVGSLNLIESAKLFGIKKFVYISTGGAVYGEPEYLPCDEIHPINPICQYGASKHTVEHYLYMYHENYGLDYAVLRYPNVYGPRQDPHGEAGVVAIFTGQMLAGEQVTINGDGEQTRDYVFVEDCARANLMVTESDRSAGIYNLGSGKGTSVNQIFAALKTHTDYKLDPVHGPAKVGETRHIHLDSMLIKETFGWEAQWTLEDGIGETVQYFRDKEQLMPVGIMADKAKVDIEHEPKISSPPVWHRLNESKAAELEQAYGVSADHAVNGKIDALADFELEESTLEEILETVVGELEASSGSILLVDEDKRIRKAAYAYNGKIQAGVSPQLEESLSKGLSGLVLSKGSAALLSNTREDNRWLPSEWDKKNGVGRSVISVPLFSHNKVVGVLTLARSVENGFAKHELALLMTISALVSLDDELIHSLELDPHA